MDAKQYARIEMAGLFVICVADAGKCKPVDLRDRGDARPPSGIFME
jgi:hypothetical protein